MSDIQTKLGIPPEIRKEFEMRDKAMSGGLKWTVTPATKSTAATAAAWTRTVVVELQDAAGARQTWYSAAIANGVSIADTSNAGTASIPSTTLTVTNGRASIVVSGDAQAWLAAETDTLTVAQATILGQTVAAKTSVETFA